MPPLPFFSSFREPWRSPRPQARLAALKAGKVPLPARRQMAIADEESEVRLQAVASIDKPDVLDAIADTAGDERVRRLALERADLLRLDLLRQSDADLAAQRAAVAAIRQETILVKAAAQAATPDLRLACLARISAPHDLAAVGRQRCGKAVALQIVERLDDPAILADLAERGASLYLRRLAAAKLAGQRQPVPEDDTETVLQELADNAQRLVGNRSFALAERRLIELEEEWRRHDPHMAHPLAQAFQAARTAFFRFKAEWQKQERRRREAEKNRAAREARVARLAAQLMEAAATAAPEFPQLAAELEKNAPPEEMDQRLAETLAAAERRYQEQLPVRRREEQRLQELCATVAALKTVSDLRQVERRCGEVRRLLAKRPFALADTAPLLAALDQQEERVRENRSALERRWAAVKEEAEALCQQIETLATAETPDAGQARRIEEAWQRLETELAPPAEGIARRYRRARARLFARLREQATTDAWRRWANRIQKEALISRIEGLASSNDFASIVAAVREARQAWKEIGPAGRAVDSGLWQQFDRICTEQYERCRPWLEEQRRERQAILEEKERLLAETVALVKNEDDPLPERAARIRQIQARWKELGAVPAGRDRRLTAAFRRRCAAFFETYRRFQHEESERRLANLAQKEALCQELEALIAAPAWEHQKTVQELQRRWKAIGPVPGERNQEIWQRFRQACDRFYAWLDGERQRNPEEKQAIVAQLDGIVAEAQEAGDLRPLTDKVLQLQQAWKSIGPAPREAADEVWRAFRLRCDRFFALKRQRQEAAHQQRLANQEAKEALIAELEALLASSEPGAPAIAQRVQELQGRFAAIGPAPRDQERRLRRQMQELADDFLQGRRWRRQERAADIDRLRTEKERLLFELEQLAGAGASSHRSSGLSLAEQLKLAMQTNFVLAERDAARARKEELDRIVRAWRRLPPLPMPLEQPLRRRYQRAMELLRRSSV